VPRLFEGFVNGLKEKNLPLNVYHQRRVWPNGHSSFHPYNKRKKQKDESGIIQQSKHLRRQPSLLSNERQLDPEITRGP